MKHAIKLSTVILASILTVVACEKEKNAPEYKAGETITITATLPSVPAAKPASKVDFTQGDGSIDLAWSESDKLTIINEDTDEYSTFTLTSVSGSKATFTGTAISGDSFTVLYPGTITSVSDMDSHSFTGQTQTGDANLAHLKTAWTAKITGLSDFSDIKFAAPAGGTFSQSGILKFYIQMPDYVSTVKSVSIEASSDVFYTDNSSTQAGALTLALTGVTLDPKNAFTAYMALSQIDSDPVSSGETVTLKIIDGDDLEWKKDITLTEDFALQAGKVNVITLDKSVWDTVERYAGGTGVDGDPWLISNAIHMVHMNEDLASGTTKYFKMIADVDMAPVTGWVPANISGSYDKGINFDGDGHVISNFSASGSDYPSLFGVLYGTVKNLTIDKATINSTNHTGVVASYIGTTGMVGNCDNVTVSNSTVTSTGSSSKRNAGVFSGIINNSGTINNCHVTGTSAVVQENTTTASNVGGFVGNVNAAATITNCTAKANVTNKSSYYTGGFIGQIGSAVVPVISNCAYLGGTISASRSNNNSPVGGFIGRIAGNAGVNITDCYVTGATISANPCGRVGGFVGDAANGTPKNTFTSCHVVNSTISAGTNTGGFTGTYGSMSKCYVDNVIITAKNQNAGGFAGYPEGSSISDCYVTSTVSVEGGTYNNIGGFMGICKGGATITNCYETAVVTGTGSGIGAFIGYVDAAPTSITKCIAWNGSLSFYGDLKGGVDDSTITGNYAGISGSVSSQATTLGWDSSIWDLSGTVPVLK